MRLLYNNIFNNYSYNYSSSDDYFPIYNIFNYNTANIGRFDNKTEGFIEVEGNGIINSFAIFYTNAYLVKIEITDRTDTRVYLIDILDKKRTIYNIEPIKYTTCKVTFYGLETNKDKLECGYFIIGEAIDFPPHDKTKSQTINYTHEQYFSITNNYYHRLLPVKRYDIWKVSFPHLTNKDRDKILDFFNDSNFYPFVLQVWSEGTISPTLSDKHYGSYNKTKYNKTKYKSKYEYIRYARYNMSKYNRSKYSSKAKCIFTYPKYYMKSGIYVCTNNKIDFKKGKSDLYQYSTELTFREVGIK